MSGPSSSSPPEGANPGAPEDTKPRLTEEEKKQNHIASGKDPWSYGWGGTDGEELVRPDTNNDMLSEQKRREAIRAGFDRLCHLVPGLEGQGRSEGLVLKKTVEYMREQLEQRRDLILRLEAEGQVVDEKYKE